MKGEGEMTEKELRELDAEIHRKVFGRECELHNTNLLHPIRNDWCEKSLIVRDFYGNPHWEQIPRYSSDIAAAWLVVEWLRAKGRCPNVAALHNGGWFVDLDDPIESASGETAPLAICRAALKSLTPSEAPAHV